MLRGLRSLTPSGRALSPAIPEQRGPAACLRRETLTRRALLGADIAALLAALALTRALTGTRGAHWWLVAAAATILVACAKLSGLYDRDQALIRSSTLDEVPALLQVTTLTVLIGSLAGGSGAREMASGQVLTFWAALIVALVLSRTCARRAVIGIAASERCLVIGDERAAEQIRCKLEGGGGVKAKLVAHVDLDRAGPWSSESFSAPRLAEIGRLAQTLDVHRAILAPRSADAGETLDLVRTLKAVGVRVSVLPRLLEVVGSSVEFDDLHGLTLMGVSRFQLTRSSLAIKRAFDVVCATVALIALAPLLGVIALAIRLDSPGGVLFAQMRAGRHGRPFRIYKFRTMIADAEAHKEQLRNRNEAKEGLFKIREDPRITRVGRLLRHTAMDELPQLINVLRGEMSLVGPRPLVLDEDRHVKGWSRRRLELTPGVTGPWQILGPARVPLSEMAAIDYLYVANWTLWSDMKILARTVAYVLRRRGL